MREPYQTNPLPELTIKELDARVRRNTSAARTWSIFAITAAVMSTFLLILAIILGEPCE